MTDLDYALPKLQPVTVYPGGSPSPLGYNIRYNDNGYSLYNFTNQTDVASVYGQMKYEFTLGSVRIRGNGGLRYERANNKVLALDRLTVTGIIGSPSDFKRNTYKRNYGKLLPSFIAVADLTDRLVLRGAAYRTYVRPQPRQFTPATVLSAPVGGVYSLTLGNPDLKPYSATSLDLSMEWYNRPNGILSVALFQKRITGLIAQVTDPKLLCPSDAIAFGLGTVTNTGARDGDEVVHLYLTKPPTQLSGRHSLARFQRVHLKAGETRQIRFDLDARALSQVDASGARQVLPVMYRVHVGGGQPDTAPGVATTLTVTGTAAVAR